MKLYDLHEQELDYNPFGEWLKSKIQRRIDKGDSRLKKLLRGSQYNLEHVRAAIKNGDCLRDPKPGSKALGPTYLEQTISNILRDLATNKEIPIGQLNDARQYFGLERLSQKKLKSQSLF
jgi:hypothetical protein